MNPKALLALISLILLVAAGCSGEDGSGTETDPRTGFTYADPAVFSALTWSDGFKATHDKFSREYAFGDWKGVDWPGLYSRFMPRIAQAEAAGDKNAYYLALHEYIYSIPDGHISLSAKNPATLTAIGRELAGGGFGMAVAELDDWRVIAAAIVPQGPADAAGIAAGAEIISWGGQAVRTAIGRIDLGAVPFKALTNAAGNEGPPATLEYSRLEQTRLLTRGPVGTSIQVVFKNPGSATSRSVALTAVDDAGQTFALLNFARRPDFSDQVDYRILPEGYGYVLVRMLHDMSNSGYPTRIFNRFQEAMTSFVVAGVPGVIVDLRGNYGGSDELAANLCGFFQTSPLFYEAQEYYDKRNGQFLGLTVNDSSAIVDRIDIKPQAPYFSGPVLALVNPATKSSGEGPAMCISRLAQGRALGFHGSNGSFGMTGGQIEMPGGYTLEFPFGRAIDEHGVIQLDSRNGIGGVAPHPRVPKTLENVLAVAAGTDVELQYAVMYLRGY